MLHLFLCFCFNFIITACYQRAERVLPFHTYIKSVSIYINPLSTYLSPIAIPRVVSPMIEITLYQSLNLSQCCSPRRPITLPPPCRQHQQRQIFISASPPPPPSLPPRSISRPPALFTRRCTSTVTVTRQLLYHRPIDTTSWLLPLVDRSVQ